MIFQFKKGEIIRQNDRRYDVAVAASSESDNFDMSEAYPNGDMARFITVKETTVVKVVSAFGRSLPIVEVLA